MKENCETCRHFNALWKRHAEGATKEERRDYPEDEGECRRFPPPLFDGTIGCWPLIRGKSGWCGEWEAKKKNTTINHGKEWRLWLRWWG